MAVMVDFIKSLLASVSFFFANGHDEVPGGQIPIAIPAAASQINAAEAVRSSIFKLMCLIIPYEVEGNAAAAAADKRKKILFQLVVPFCCAWAVGLQFLPKEIKLQNEFTYSLLSIIFSLAFSNILIATLISDRSRATSHGFMVTGVLFGVTAFFMSISIIPLNMPLVGAVWFIYVGTIIVIVAVRLNHRLAVLHAAHDLEQV